MIRYIARRLAVAAVTLLVISFVVYLALSIVPGDVARLVAGQFGTQESVAHIRKQLGLDKPVLVQYWHWLTGFVSGDWGNSFRYQTALRPLVLGRLWNSVLLGLIGFVIVVPLSILAGVVSALKMGRPLDRILTTVGLVGIATPEIVTSMFLILVFALWLKVFPTWAAVPDHTAPLSAVSHLVLPVVALALVMFGYIARMVRANMIEQLASDYTRTAVLKGLPHRYVVVKHVLRNALIPTITVVANQVPYLIGGQIVVESIFNYPGVGNLIYNAALAHDYPVFEATTLIIATILFLSNLAADLLYGYADPRLRQHPPRRRRRMKRADVAV